MRLKRHVAVLALAGAAAAALSGGAYGQSPPTADLRIDNDVLTPPSPTDPSTDVRPVPEINVIVAAPKVDVDVESPFLSVGPGKALTIRPQGLEELKQRLAKGQWRGALDVIEGPMRARLTRDPLGRLGFSAQAAPVAPPQPDAPGVDPFDAQKQKSDLDQQRVLELYRAQLGGLQMQKAAYLGVSTSPVPDALRQHLGLKEGLGLVVDFVEPGSPAEQAGLKQYDILNKLDDQMLVNAQQLAVLVRARKAGEKIKLTITRGGKEQTLSAAVVEKDVKPLEALGFWDERLDMKDWGDAKPDVKSRLDRDRRGDAQRKEKQRTVRAESGDRTTSVLTDDEYQLILSGPAGHAGGRHLTVVEKKTGKLVYDGNVDDEDARTKLPPPVAQRLKQLDEAGHADKSAKEAGSSDKKPGWKTENKFELRLGKPGERPQINADKKAAEKDAHGKNHDAGHKDEDADDKDDDNDNDSDEDREESAVIRGGDILQLSVTDLVAPGVETVKQARVTEGVVSMPYVGRVKAEGLTPEQVEREVAKTYRDAKLIQNANVNVDVKVIGSSDKEPEGHKP